MAECGGQRSEIVGYEDWMPYPNMSAAEADGIEGKTLESYHAQLQLRKHLNQIHRMFYTPSYPGNQFVAEAAL